MVATINITVINTANSVKNVINHTIEFDSVLHFEILSPKQVETQTHFEKERKLTNKQTYRQADIHRIERERQK
jgi:adenosine/AMP kinase